MKRETFTSNAVAPICEFAVECFKFEANMLKFAAQRFNIEALIFNFCALQVILASFQAIEPVKCYEFVAQRCVIQGESCEFPGEYLSDLF